MANAILNVLNLQKLKITSSVDVEKLEIERVGTVTGPRTWILIVGLTGAGKSSFIESLAGPNSSVKNISSGRLEGYTQEVSLYRVHGLTKGDSVLYLFDTPGFADEKISTVEIVTKIQRTLREVGIYTTLTHIMYLTPITSTRLPGTQRAVLNTVKALTGLAAGKGFTVVTTMWDTICNEQARRRAEDNYEQLKNEIWKDYLDHKADITKFYNTTASAISVLDLAAQRHRHERFHLESTIMGPTIPSKAPFAENLYSDLVQRIQSLKMKKDVINRDLGEVPTEADEENAELKAILSSQLDAVNRTLEKFEQQLLDFDTLPPPSPFALLPHLHQSAGSSSSNPNIITSLSSGKGTHSRGPKPTPRSKPGQTGHDRRRWVP